MKRHISATDIASYAAVSFAFTCFWKFITSDVNEIIMRRF